MLDRDIGFSDKEIKDLNLIHVVEGFEEYIEKRRLTNEAFTWPIMATRAEIAVGNYLNARELSYKLYSRVRKLGIVSFVVNPVLTTKREYYMDRESGIAYMLLCRVGQLYQADAAKKNALQELVIAARVALILNSLPDYADLLMVPTDNRQEALSRHRTIDGKPLPALTVYRPPKKLGWKSK